MLSKKSSALLQKSWNKAIVLVKKIPWIVAKHAFMVLLVLILLDFFLGEYLFYHYVVIPKTQGPEYVMQPVMFKQKMYESVLGQRQKREEFFANPKAHSYSDPF